MMMKKIKNFLAVGVAGFLVFSLVGCATTVPGPTFPDLTYQHLVPIELDVASVENVYTYKPTLNPPNVDHLFPVSPGTALSRWASDRLRAGGAAGLARFTILDASVRETTLEIKKGLKGVFTKDQSERYDAVLAAKLEIFDADGASRGFASATASRSVTVREDATVNEREQAWFSLTEALMLDINGELEKNISRYLASWLK